MSYITSDRCCGKYSIFPYNGRPLAVKKYARRKHKCFCHIEGMNSDQIAIVTQTCERVIIITSSGSEIMSEILPEDYGQISDYLFLALDLENAAFLTEYMKHIDSRSPTVFLEFEVKHNHFNMLHYAIEHLPDSVIHYKLVPTANDITPTGQLMNAQDMVFQCPKCNPPVLVKLAYRANEIPWLLDTVTRFIRIGNDSGNRIRILLCTQSQVSCKMLIDGYISQTESDKQYPWRQYIIRLISDAECAETETMKNFRCRSVYDYCQTFPNSDAYSVVITTMLTSLLLVGTVPSGYFTHIFIHDAARLQEPEAIAPLCLAAKESIIIMVGDIMKVDMSACMLLSVIACIVE